MTPAVEAAKRAGIEFRLHEYEGVEVGEGDYALAVAAGGRTAARAALQDARGVGGRAHRGVRRAGRPAARPARGRQADEARGAAGGRASHRVRHRRHQPARPAPEAADDGRRIGARLGHDPRQRRETRAADRARAERPGASSPVRPWLRWRRSGGDCAQQRAPGDCCRLVEKMPADVVPEVVLTGSVSRGVADDASDVEMLVVTQEQLDFDTCFELARATGLERLGTWGPQGPPTSRVSGYLEGVPFELIWWSREHAESSINAESAAADAIANGVALRTCGLLAAWQERLSTYPDDLAAERIEDAALTWGGFAAAGLLTIARPGERLALVERMVDDASRVLQIVYALNRTWLPTTKRVALRTASARRQAGAARRTDRGSAHRVGPAAGPHRHDAAASRYGRARAAWAERRSRAGLACRSAGDPPRRATALGAPPEARGDHDVEADQHDAFLPGRLAVVRDRARRGSRRSPARARAGSGTRASGAS